MLCTLLMVLINRGKKAANATSATRGWSPMPMRTRNSGSSADLGIGCRLATNGSATVRTWADHPMSNPSRMPAAPPISNPMPMR